MTVFDDTVSDFFAPDVSDKVIINGKEVLGIFSDECEDVVGGHSGITECSPLFHTASKFILDVTVDDVLEYKGDKYKIIEIKRTEYNFSDLILSIINPSKGV